MARPKTPLRLAELTGAAAKNPQRYRGRSEPSGGGPLGEPPTYFNKAQKVTWERFRTGMPWLTASDFAIVEITCITAAQIEADPTNATASLMREYRQQLAQIGGTPTTRSNVTVPEDPDGDDEWARFELP